MYRTVGLDVTTPQDLLEWRHNFRDDPPAKWISNPDACQIYARIFGLKALETVINTGKVQENKDASFVQYPYEEVVEKTAEPSGLPKPGTEPLLSLINIKLDACLSELAWLKQRFISGR